MNKKIKTIAVLTGGGDCPGLNCAIKAIVNKCSSQNIKVVGIKHGWQGLLSQDNYSTMALDDNIVQHIDREGGTILKTSRTNPFKEKNGTNTLLANINKLNIDGLIAIGGEDTLGVAYRCFKELNLPVVGVPKTIDRDLGGTQYSLGFESAVQVITDSVDSLRSTASSHCRIFVVEVMGRHAGHLALRGGISSGASIVLIPEHQFDMNKIAAILEKKYEQGNKYAIVMVAEGAMPVGKSELKQSDEVDAFGHIRLGGISVFVADELRKKTGFETRAVNLSHLQRGGRPIAYDRRMGFYFGCAAVEAIIHQKFGMMSCLKQGRICLQKLQIGVSKLHTVDVDKFYDTKKYLAKDDILGQLGPMIG